MTGEMAMTDETVVMAVIDEIIVTDKTVLTGETIVTGEIVVTGCVGQMRQL